MSQFFQRRRVAQVASHEALWYSGHGRPAWRTHLLAIAITSDTIGSSTTTPQLYGSTALRLSVLWLNDRGLARRTCLPEDLEFSRASALRDGCSKRPNRRRPRPAGIS